jgi:hypothetical protein
MKFRKHQLLLTAIDLDFRSTGGPFIPAGTPVRVERVRRTGELWVWVAQHGLRHLSAEQLMPFQS